jgi:hypothetical protein
MSRRRFGFMLTLRAAAVLAAALLPGGALSPAFAGDPGKAEGTLTLDTTPTILTHAYAREIVAVPELRGEDTPERTIMLILTDRPMPADGRIDDTAAARLAYLRELRALVIEIDPATGRVPDGWTLLPDEELPQYFSAFEEDSPDLRLTDFAEDRAQGIVTGRIASGGPIEVVNYEERPGPQSYSFDVAFTATVLPAAPVIGTIEADKARSSEQGQAFRQFLDAVAAGDADAVRATLTSDHPLLSVLDSGAVETIQQMVFADGGSADAVYAKLEKIYLFDGTATALLHGPDGWSSYSLAMEEGRWKMGY